MLSKKNIIVTGSSSGIGLSITKALLKNKANVLGIFSKSDCHCCTRANSEAFQVPAVRIVRYAHIIASSNQFFKMHTIACGDKVFFFDAFLILFFSAGALFKL